jgi:hypothetical protein
VMGSGEEWMRSGMNSGRRGGLVPRVHHVFCVLLVLYSSMSSPAQGVGVLECNDGCVCFSL